MTVPDQLVAALDVRLDDLGAVVVERGVDERADRELERLEQLEAAPDADAVAVVAPRVIEDVGLGALRPERGAEAGAEVEVLDVEADVDLEALPAGPVVVSPAVDRGIRVAPVSLEGPHQTRAWPGRRAPKATRRCPSRLPSSRSCL